jgi:hypothetical protein
LGALHAVALLVKIPADHQVVNLRESIRYSTSISHNRLLLEKALPPFAQTEEISSTTSAEIGLSALFQSAWGNAETST